MDTMPKDGRYFLVKLPLWEALEEIAAGVFEYTWLNDEHAGDWCFYYVHDDWLLINDSIKGEGMMAEHFPLTPLSKLLSPTKYYAQ